MDIKKCSDQHMMIIGVAGLTSDMAATTRSALSKGMHPSNIRNSAKKIQALVKATGGFDGSKEVVKFMGNIEDMDDAEIRRYFNGVGQQKIIELADKVNEHLVDSISRCMRG